MTRFQVPPGSIVVGVDGSEDSERAVTWAAEQAKVEARVLAIVHSTDQMALRDTAWLDLQAIDHVALTRALGEAARATAANARERALAVAPDVQVVTALVDVDPRTALVEMSSDAHLVVLGSRGRGPVSSALMGSVSAFVSKRAHCPVVVCRPPDRPVTKGHRVLVGADGTAASRPVLEFAFQQASLHGLPLTVMHCFWDVVVATRGAGVVPQEEPDHAQDVTRDLAHAAPDAQDDLSDLRLLLAESAAGLAEKYPDVVVTQQLARGLVDECLADAVPDASLIVVGRAPTTGWSRFLHTSCAVAVLERAHTTVAVVPESA